MLKFKTLCALLAYLSSNLLNVVGLSLFRYFEVVCAISSLKSSRSLSHLLMSSCYTICSHLSKRLTNKQNVNILQFCCTVKF